MEKSLKRAFDVGAGSYDSARRKLVPCFDDFYRAAIDLIPVEHEAQFDVLDLGAGTGLFSALIAYSFPGARITLLDVSDEMLARARERMKFDRTATLSAQLGWLREAGFREVACSYRNLIFAVYSGEK